MAIKDPELIKQIVRSNFDKSVEFYERFEQKYKFFEYLAIELAKVCKIKEKMVVCDIGCGTGISSFVLQRVVGSQGKVIGIDFSEAMLNLAKEKLKKYLLPYSIDFILCDADNIAQRIDMKVHAVLYNASIFLIPNPIKTLTSAYAVLRNNGTIGMNYLIGLFDETKNTDLFQLASQENNDFTPYGRRIVDIKIIGSFLREAGFRNIKEEQILREMSINEVKEFYSIPAQSASLYPKTPYKERLRFIDLLINYFQAKGIQKFYHRWSFYVGKKL